MKIIASGKIETIAWTLNSDGELRFSGGILEDNLDWLVLEEDLKNQVKEITFEKTIKTKENLKGLFCNYENLTTVKGIDNIYTTEEKNMWGMFHNCGSLTHVISEKKYDTNELIKSLVTKTP